MAFPNAVEYPTEGGEAVDAMELHHVAMRELDNAALWTGTRITKDRAESLRAWLSTPRGDEREGRSQVTTRDVFEQVEWALAFLTDVFESVERLVEFEPHGEEDVDTAKQATESTHLAFNRQKGHKVLYTAAKDGFISKNGVVKVEWTRTRAAEFERYEQKSLQELMMLVQDPEFRLRAVTAYIPKEDGSREEVPPEAIEDPDIQVLVLFDVVGVRVDLDGHISIDNVAPENFFHNADCIALDHESCRFVAERIPTTASQLVAMGVERELVDDLPSSVEEFSAYGTDEHRARRFHETGLVEHADRKDSEKPVVVWNAYVLADMDGDGISEWWKLLLGGDFGEILLGFEPSVGHSFISWTPIPITHRLNGLSFGDVASDIQVTNTSNWRQYLDALYLTTDPMFAVLSQGNEQTAVPMANLQQLMRVGPGRWVEEYAPNAIRPLLQSSDAQKLLPSMELNSKMLQSRTGVAPEAMGIDPTKISQHVYGAVMQQNAAAQRLILYARLFARDLVVPLFEMIFREQQLHASAKQMVRSHDAWVPIDPSQWTTKVDVHCAIPLGHASRAERVANLMTVGSIQERLLTGGRLNMVSDSHLYHTVRDTIEALGFKNVHSYVADPETAPPVEPAPSPEEEALALQQQIETMRLELERQKLEVTRFDSVVKAKKAEWEHELGVQKLRVESEQEVEYDPEGVRAGS